jgi:TolB-like protein/Tfp pilus assembly protein PilF
LVYQNHQQAGAADAARPHAIAVLPIANLSGNANLSYLCDGATEEIIARLGDEDPVAVRVIARTSAMSFRDTKLNARQIGRALGVDYLLEGAFQGEEKHIRLIERLIRTSDQTELWSKTYIGGPDQLQSFENDIADRAALTLPGTRKPGGPPQQTVVTAEAHDLYLQGLYAVGQRSRSGFESALVSLGNAVQREPRYAEAYAELAVCYNLMGQYGWMRQDEARSQGKAAALQALALDPTLAEARAALGFSYWFYDWDSDRGREELANATARQPNNVDAHHWLGMVLLTSGQLSDSEREIREALKLDPASPILHTNLGWVHYTQGRFPLAVQEMSAVLKQNPGFISAHYKLISAAYMMGDRRRGWQEVQALNRLDSVSGLQGRAGAVYQKDGESAALKMIVDTPDDGSYKNEVEEARYLMFANDPAGAVQQLQKGMQRHNAWLIFVPTDPAFAPLRKDPAFQQIVATVQSGTLHVAATH